MVVRIFLADVGLRYLLQSTLTCTLHPRDVQDNVTDAAPTTSEDLREGREDISPVCGATDQGII